ncbi:hypothetical protein [Aquiflexum sp.]|uniref:hypothetical protein n=1 Tax=Aquiflexum sp. TaxID=1872584 RepID=UPI0035935068
MESNSHMLIYQTEDGKTKIQTRLENETVWLTIEQMAELFQKGKSTINEHIQNIYIEGELVQESSMRKIGISDFSTKPTNFYNLDVIISVGYRVLFAPAHYPTHGRGYQGPLLQNQLFALSSIIFHPPLHPYSDLLVLEPFRLLE